MVRLLAAGAIKKQASATVHRSLGLLWVAIFFAPHLRKLGRQKLLRNLMFVFAEQRVVRQPSEIFPELRRRGESDFAWLFFLGIIGHVEIR